MNVQGWGPILLVIVLALGAMAAVGNTTHRLAASHREHPMSEWVNDTFAGTNRR